MRKWIATAAIVAMTTAGLSADLMFVQTMTIEGAAAAMMGNAALPRMTMRIKGQKSRADIEMGGKTLSAIMDLSTRQLILLNTAAKTATVTSPDVGATGATIPKVDVSFKPTGKTQVLEGQTCNEHAIRIQMSMAEVTGGQLPPETTAAMKDVHMVMDGSIWIAPSAPGAAEYAAFTKAAMSSNLFGALTGMAAGQAAAGFDKLMEAAASAAGLPYLTDINMRFEGSGPMVEMMQKMGPIRMIQKTVTVSTDPIADSVFQIPEGFTTDKK